MAEVIHAHIEQYTNSLVDNLAHNLVRAIAESSSRCRASSLCLRNRYRSEISQQWFDGPTENCDPRLCLYFVFQGRHFIIFEMRGGIYTIYIYRERERLPVMLLNIALIDCH